MEKFLLISTSNELVRVAPEHIVCITSDGNYSTLIQADGESRIVSYQLGKLAEMITTQLGVSGNDFIRLGRAVIINRNFVHYINIPKQKLIVRFVLGEPYCDRFEGGFETPKIYTTNLNLEKHHLRK